MNMKRTVAVCTTLLIFIQALMLIGVVRADGPTGTNHQLDYAFPVPLGVSTSNNRGCFAGTLGFRVKDSMGRLGYVTNNHVAAAGGSKLCPNKAPLGTPQGQPGEYDFNCSFPTPAIGTLNKFISIIRYPFGTNTVDTAFVLIDQTNPQVSNQILDIGSYSKTAASPNVGEVVTKSGRTTGQTLGTVQTINATVLVDYGSGCGFALFKNQVIIAPNPPFSSFTLAGDSGSPVVSTQRFDVNNLPIPLGLIFAGDGTNGVANPLPAVLGALGVTLD